MRNEFLKGFSKTQQAKDLVEYVLQPDLDVVKDVNADLTKAYSNATNGEILVGKKIASEVIQNLINDIAHYQNSTKKMKDPRDNMN